MILSDRIRFFGKQRQKAKQHKDGHVDVDKKFLFCNQMTKQKNDRKMTSEKKKNDSKMKRCW